MSPCTVSAVVTSVLRACLIIALAACGAAVTGAAETDAAGGGQRSSAWDVPRGVERDFGRAPPIPRGDLSPELAAAVETAFGDLQASGWGEAQSAALRLIVEADDVRLAWLVSDLTGIVSDPGLAALLANAASELLAVKIDYGDHWRSMTDHLMAWDVPAKRAVYTLVLPAWERLLQPGSVDWRHVSWGGVLIDDRP